MDSACKRCRREEEEEEEEEKCDTLTELKRMVEKWRMIYAMSGTPWPQFKS